MSDPAALGLLPEGFRDRLPPKAEAAERLTRALADSIATHGYHRIQPPLVEFIESLGGRLADGGTEDLLRLIDPLSQRIMAVRGDITPQAGRIAATRLAHEPRPLRLAYSGPVLHVGKPQVGADRERTQVGAELIGNDTVAAAHESLTVALEALTAAGCQRLSVDLTLPSLVAELAETRWPVDDLAAVRAALDGKDKVALSAVGGDAYGPLIDAAGPVKGALAALRTADLGDSFARRLDAVQALSDAACPLAQVTLDPTERQGFEFQSWLGFSLFAGDIAQEVGRGGTYEVHHPDGAKEVAVGFSLYVDPLVEAGLGSELGKRLFVPLDADADLAAKARADGWTTVAALADSDDAEALRATHHLTKDGPKPL
ncbi:MAG: ATP phosphoribosyltransferase regulatory subunit [Pacificimonas sp.]